MSRGRFVSYSQHGEDVVIWRALGHVPDGFYVDVGAADPTVDSVTRALYERGWRGIHVEALSEYAEQLRTEREGDVVVEAAAGQERGELTFYRVPGTGLSTTVAQEATVAEALGFGVNGVTVPMRTVDDILAEHLPPGRELHVLKVDVEGAEEAVLRGAQLARWRPWVVIVEATRPNSTERTSEAWQHLVTGAGYVPCMFDGLNLWFRRDDLPELHDALSYPACPLDVYKRAGEGAAAGASATALARAKAAQEAAEKRAADAKNQLDRTRRRLKELESSPWWRMTRPGRAAVHRAKRWFRPSAGSAAKPAVSPPSPDLTPAAVEPAAVRQAPQPPPQGTPDDVLQARLDALLAAEPGSLPDKLTGRDRARWVWALHVAFTGSLADDLIVENLLGLLDLEGPDALLGELRQLASHVGEGWVRTASLDVVTVPLVDVSATATNDLHTGIQRVVRETASRWAAGQRCELVVLDKDARTLRWCAPLEEARIVAWPPPDDLRAAAVPVPATIVLPWGTTIVVPEVSASADHADLARGIAVHSGTELAVVAFDMIPLTRAENISTNLPTRFARYLSVVKHSRRVSGISATVAQEFASFFGALVGQGLPSPEVRAHPLPAVARDTSGADVAALRSTVTGGSEVPVVLSVSSLAPRKNHLRTVEAAERLWREGLRFQLVFIAGWDATWEAFDEAVTRLQAKGRPIRVLNKVDEDTLWEAYRLARCTVFVSLVEGFGLPAAESLAVATPVVLSDYGSMAEIGEGGGALLVDPRDVDDIAGAIRTLLLDDQVHAELSEAARQRPRATWDDYARETWDWLVDGVEPAPSGTTTPLAP